MVRYKTYTHKATHVVTKGKWNYGGMTGGDDIPTGMIKVQPFYIDKHDRIIRSKHYGMLISNNEYQSFGLKHGYLRIVNKGSKVRFRI